MVWNLRLKVTLGSFSCIQITVGVHCVMVSASFSDACGMMSATSTTAMSSFSASPIRSSSCA
ncbi:hypothetical protein WJ970_10785 [Achromobacter xylosoxidans]